MTERDAKVLLDKIVGQVLGFQNPLTLEQFMQKFAFDIRLPQKVTDAMDGSETWASSTNPLKFVKMENARGDALNQTLGADSDYRRPSRQLKDMDDILAAWSEINFTTTERYKESLNVGESDNIDRSENVWRSQDIHKSKNIILSDGVFSSEFVVASQRSGNSTFCIRIEDSGECSNSFGISWSGNITNCFFLHDTGDMQDSMFCTNISGQRFCIANMQFDETEYKRLRDIVARWILTG